MQHLLKWFAHPVFEDPDQARRARLLSLILNTLITALLIIIAGKLVCCNTPRLAYVVYLLMIAILIGLRGLVLWQQFDLAAVLLVLSFSILTALLVMVNGTILTPATTVYVLLIAISGLLLDRRAIIFTALGNSLVLLAVMLLQNAGWLPALEVQVDFSHWLTFTMLFLVTGMFTYLALHMVRDALARARQDLSERQRIEETLRESEARLIASELKFSHAFHSSPASMTISSPTRGLLLVNSAFERVTGYTAAEVTGRHVADLGLWVYPEKRMEAVKIILETGHVHGFEMIYNTRGGCRQEALLSAEIIEMDGEACYLVSMYDVTDLRRAEAQVRELNAGLEQRVQQRTAELEAANRELEASNRELQSFSYSMSHDLRTPLRAIDGYSRLLVQDYAPLLNEEGTFYLENVRKAAQRMGELIDNLLALSRVTRVGLTRTHVSLSQIAIEVAGMLQRRDPERQVDFIIQPGLSARGDAALLRLMFENLLGNAWKFTGRNAAPRIEFGTRMLDGRPVYFVSDNGIGFDNRYADKLFTAFQRLHSGDEFTGSGVGLASVQRVVHRHGGQIWADGCPGEGATFYFILPGT